MGMTFVIVSMPMMFFGQILVRIFLEGTLAASGAKVIGFARVLALVPSGFNFDFHFANRVNRNHSCLQFERYGMFGGFS
jgi:hypothetical protein